MGKYRLEAFKIILSFTLLIVAGGIIEKWHSGSVKERERDFIFLDNAVNSFKAFGSSLASLRASASRLLNSNFSEAHLAYYHSSYKEYTKAKLPFAMSMQLSERGTQADADMFGALNSAIVKMDQCFINHIETTGNARSCEIEIGFEEFVELSTRFERVVIESLTN